MELKDIILKNSEFFQKHFEEVFENDFKVECEWGFPKIKLDLIKKQENTEVLISIILNVITENFILGTLGKKIIEGKESPEIVNIDSDTIAFIVNRTIEITKSFFGIDKTENKEEIKE